MIRGGKIATYQAFLNREGSGEARIPSPRNTPLGATCLTNLGPLSRAQLEAGRQALLQLLGQGKERGKSRRDHTLSLPKIRPLPEPGVRDFFLRRLWQAAFPQRIEQGRGEKPEHEAGRKISADLTFLDLEIAEPFPDAEFGRVVIMMGRLMQRLKEGGVDRERAAGLEHAMDLARCARRIAQVFEDIESKDVIENVVAKWKSVRVADHVGVAKNLMFQLDAAGILQRGRAGAQMQNALIAPREDFFKLCAHRVAGVRGRDGDDFPGVGQEDRNALHDREIRAAICATQCVRVSRQLLPASGTGKESDEIRIHLAE